MGSVRTAPVTRVQLTSSRTLLHCTKTKIFNYEYYKKNGAKSLLNRELTTFSLAPVTAAPVTNLTCLKMLISHRVKVISIR